MNLRSHQTRWFEVFVRREQVIYAPVLPGAAEALLTWNLAKPQSRPVLWIGDGTQSLGRIS